MQVYLVNLLFYLTGKNLINWFINIKLKAVPKDLVPGTILRQCRFVN